VGAHLKRVRRIVDYDHRHGTELASTLEAFVRERGSAQRTSELLYIHRNTLRQRLGKISALMEHRVEAIDDWLPLLLALLVLREG